ncbi:MAG: hypothetical protein A4E19_12440 [Nitrospira sp. SG-bin1]|nr:MAG: hypothetical protein A4E19_12440 [Nitrospira sp. SG-bin1]
MAMVTVKATSESVSDGKLTRKEVAISILEETVWSARYSLAISTSTQGTDRIQVTCFFRAEEAYFLSHDRQILPLLREAHPPYPVGCVLWIREGNILHQVDLPKYPHLRLYKQDDAVVAQFVVQDRYGSGLILWGAHKLKKSPTNEQIYVRVNRLGSTDDAVWLEPYPHGARSAICLTDHPDYDSVVKLSLLSEVFSKNDIRITKGVFPSSDPEIGRPEPGLDVLEYKKSVDLLYEGGSEIAYHGFSPGRDAPPLSECLRRIDMMSQYSPRTWIDHGTGEYLFSRGATLKEGASLVDMLSQVGIENYWSYTDVWENPARNVDIWAQRQLFLAFSNVLYFLWDKKRVRIPQLFYYGSSVLKNLLGQYHLRPIMHAPWKMKAWESVAAQVRGLKYCHENPMVLYDMNGQCSFMSKDKMWVFDTILCNHLGFQLRPSNVDLLCKQNGLLLAHCYFGHQKENGGTMNCFIRENAGVTLIPEFVENVEYISEKQRRKDLVTLSFAALREALTNFATASLVRTADGWEITCEKAVVGSHQALSFSGPARQWSKETVHYSEVEEQAIAQIPASR